MRPTRVRVTVRVEVLEPVNGSSSFERVSTSAQVADERLISPVTSDPATCLDGIATAAETCGSEALHRAIAGVLSADPVKDLRR